MKSDNDLFAKEEAVVAGAEQCLTELAYPDDADREKIFALVKEYRKLLRTTRRMMRLSDRNERELNALAEQQRAAAEEIARKNQELETLSGKLAKYLSPQVYSSIFSGRQEVKLASRRGKLTVFFSDIVGFTEMTDRMESEDLTRLLNRYLTEMSRVATDFGATIDKFVGDAIMIFFGDPESRGVREDALACVKMAIKMQSRLDELRIEWQREGVRDPIRCRMGINTGFCTIGNFGSEDRMDYTIIGGAVNLASRLEHEATPGGIYISYETWTQIRDEIDCEEVGTLNVRGVAYPVAVYKVLGSAGTGDRVQRINAELPNLQLFMDPSQMTKEELAECEAVLSSALQALSETRNR